MITTIKDEQSVYSYTQLFRNHSKLYSDNIGLILSRAAHASALEAMCQDQVQVIAGLQASLHTKTQIIRSVEASLSWKISKPLRSAKAFCRRYLVREESTE